MQDSPYSVTYFIWFNQFSCLVVSDSLRPHGLQHTGLPCLSLSPRVCSNSCPLSPLSHVHWVHWTMDGGSWQEAVIKTISKKKKCKNAKCLSEEALQIAEKREAKGKGEKERHTHLNAEFQRISRRDKKAFLSDQCKEIEENNRMGKTRDLQEN